MDRNTRLLTRWMCLIIGVVLAVMDTTAMSEEHVGRVLFSANEQGSGKAIPFRLHLRSTKADISIDLARQNPAQHPTLPLWEDQFSISSLVPALQHSACPKENMNTSWRVVPSIRPPRERSTCLPEMFWSFRRHLTGSRTSLQKGGGPGNCTCIGR